LDYILARRPDEFGLVTDKEGFIKVKDLLKALSEEEGLSYVRRAHLDEILITLPDPSFEIVGNTIRAKVTEGTSALFLMTSGAVMDKVADEVKHLDFEIIATNLSKEQEEKLKATFAEE